MTASVPLDRERTTLELISKCSTCGDEEVEAAGLPRTEPVEDPATDTAELVFVPRAPGEGIFVRREDLGTADLFRLRELPGWVLCTPEVKDFVEEREYTNVTFDEMGEITP